MASKEVLFPFDNNLYTKYGELAGPKIEGILGEVELWVVTGPSGAGKSTIISEYLEKNPRKSRTIRFADAMAKTELQKDKRRGLWVGEDFQDMSLNLTEDIFQAIIEEDEDTLIILEDMALLANDKFDRGVSPVEWVFENKEYLTAVNRRPFLTCIVGDPANQLEAGTTRDDMSAMDGEGNFLIPDEDVRNHLYNKYTLRLLGLPNDPLSAGRTARRYYLRYVATTARMIENNTLLDEAARRWIANVPPLSAQTYRVSERLWVPPIVETRQLEADLHRDITDSVRLHAGDYQNRTDYLEFGFLRNHLNLTEDEGILIHNPYHARREKVIDLRHLMDMRSAA